MKTLKIKKWYSESMIQFLHILLTYCHFATLVITTPFFDIRPEIPE